MRCGSINQNQIGFGNCMVITADNEDELKKLKKIMKSNPNLRYEPTRTNFAMNGFGDFKAIITDGKDKEGLEYYAKHFNIKTKFLRPYLELIETLVNLNISKKVSVDKVLRIKGLETINSVAAIFKKLK